MVEMIRELVETFVVETVMPTGKNLLPTIKFAAGITVISLLCRLIGVPCYFSISGCVLGLLVLLMVLIIERREYSKVKNFYDEIERRSKNEVSKLRGNVKLYIEKNTQGRQQDASADGEDE